MIDRSDVRFYVKVQPAGASSADRLDETVRVLSMSYEDSESAADKLKLSVDNYDLRNFDEPTFAVGSVLEVTWGYPGSMTQPRECVVTKVTGGQVLSVEALGRASLMNRVMKVRTFEQVSRSDVARIIAGENGYGADLLDIEETKVVLPQITQARMTDAALLRQLAQKEGFAFYIDPKGFHFHERRLSQPPKKVFTFFTDRKGTIISFNLESDITAKSGSVKAVARDPLKKDPIAETANDESTSGRPTLASVMMVVDPKTGEKSLQKTTGSEAVVATTATTAADAKAQAAAAYKRSQLAAVQMTWECIGDATIEAKSVVEGAGFGRRLSGNYYVTTVTHKIKPGYTMTLKVRRDGTSSGTGAASSGAVNNAAAPAQAADGSGASNELEAKKVVDPKTGETTMQYVKKGG